MFPKFVEEKPNIIKLSITISIIFFVALPIFSQDRNIYDRAKDLLTEFNEKHISPPSRDSLFSLRIGELLLDEMDDRGYFFLDFDSVLIMETKYFDEEGLSKTLDFHLRNIYKNYHERIEYVAKTFENLAGKGDEYNDFGELTFGKRKKRYQEDYPALLSKWKRYVAYSTYLRIFDNVEPKIMMDKNATLRIFPKYWDEVVADETCGLNDYDLSYEDFCNVFLECIAKAHDPHSAYFTYEESTDFFNSMSTQNLSFGFYLDRNKSNSLEITYLIPGGAAWNSGELNEGDIILMLVAGEQDTIDLRCKDPYDLIDELNNGKSKKLLIKFKKANGEIKSITLKKSKAEIDENVIKSYILGDDIGYINLPGFYSAWDNLGASGCAEDMAKEVMKLNRDNIKGLIVDLRFNGGGSLREAVELCGIFINEGPLCITHSEKSGTKIMKDMNRGTIYDGPMLILVNPYSASASELFAGIMQDYHRAIIVGDTTFGKGSVQRTFDSDTDNTGFKVTMEGFYSIDLQSHQNKGIAPDIYLPNYYFKRPREKNEKFSLEFPSVEKDLVIKLLPEMNIAPIKSKSENRIAENEYFQNRIKIQKLINEFDSKTYHLNYEGVLGIYEYFNSFIKYDTDLSEEEFNTVKNNSTDAILYDFDEVKKEVNLSAMEEIKNDIYIRECTLIMNDLIKNK
ncbi:MAG: S41 family peptidase [Crocinitomicaceae bacterium]